MTAHTPGPWRAANLEVLTRAGELIADVAVGGVLATPEAAANARLLAAAPALSEALQSAQRVLAMLTEPEAIRSTTVHDAWAQAVAAEAKARAALKLVRPAREEA